LTYFESNRDESEPKLIMVLGETGNPTCSNSELVALPYSGRPKAEALEKLLSNTESGLFPSTIDIKTNFLTCDLELNVLIKY